MCYGCWEEFEKPSILNDKTRALPALIKAVYGEPTGGVGGLLHIVLDDWNIEDDSVAYCADDKNHNRPMTSAERVCIGHMLTMTEQERASGMALEEGWLRDTTESTSG